MKYIIIGGVAGGASAAARLRRLDENAEIILFERGEYISYANCGLPYYIGGIITDRGELFVQTAEEFRERNQIDVRTRQEVTAIDAKAKTMTVRNVLTGDTYTETYDKLALSPGAEPLRPPIVGIDNKGIFTLRNVPDTDRIKAFIDNEKPQHAVVVGGGFIGLEMAENLHEQGIQVTVVEMANQVMAPLDFSMAQLVHHHLVTKGVQLILEDGVTRFEKNGNGLTIHLRSGKEIKTDMVLLSIGVRPDSKLAREAGLTIGTLGGIAVNERLQTSDPDIYALGDAVEVRNIVSGKPALIPLAGPANKQGRIVADNMVNDNKCIYPGSIGNSIAKVFDLTVAAAGVNGKTLRKDGMPYQSAFTHAGSHAGYYPGSQTLSVKILFASDNGQLYGAQVVGYEGVDKRIEMMAQVIQRRGTIHDLMDLEHAYAPPYSGAKDPVNVIGYIAENILNGKVRNMHWRDLATMGKDAVIVDVRSNEEFEAGTFPEFIHIPLDDLRQRLSEIPKDKRIIVACAIGRRGYMAYRILVQNGYKDVYNLSGGYQTWREATNTPGKVNTARTL